MAGVGRFRLVRVGDLTPEHEQFVRDLEAADQRDREREQRHHYESHTWDGETCIVCDVTWTDCLDECPETP